MKQSTKSKKLQTKNDEFLVQESIGFRVINYGLIMQIEINQQTQS